MPEFCNAKLMAAADKLTLRVQTISAKHYDELRANRFFRTPPTAVLRLIFTAGAVAKIQLLQHIHKTGTYKLNCKCLFLFGGDERDRTAGLYVANVPLSQLSYIPDNSKSNNLFSAACGRLCRRHHAGEPSGYERADRRRFSLTGLLPSTLTAFCLLPERADTPPFSHLLQR